MKILVPVKRVVDYTVKIRVKSDGSGVELAKSRNLAHRYIYQNYAAAAQDVFSGYGPESQARLKAIHEKYDPTNVFTKLQPGYFKIN